MHHIIVSAQVCTIDLAVYTYTYRPEPHLSAWLAVRQRNCIFSALWHTIIAKRGMSYSISCPGASARQELVRSMAVFKHYLDTKGRPMATDPTFLAFFALPYIREPQCHPSFQQLFTPAFASQLQSQLKHFLRTIPDDQPLPHLYTMFMSAQSSQLSGSGPAIGAEPPEQHGAKSMNDKTQTQTANGTALSEPADSAQDSRPPATALLSSHSSRPVTALLSGHQALADLISKSSARYAEHLQAPSLEPSADILHGQ